MEHDVGRPDAKAGSHVTFLSCSFPQFERGDRRGVAVGEIGGDGWAKGSFMKPQCRERDPPLAALQSLSQRHRKACFTPEPTGYLHIIFEK